MIADIMLITSCFLFFISSKNCLLTLRSKQMRVPENFRLVSRVFQTVGAK